jgi:HNH endonuclease
MRKSAELYPGQRGKEKRELFKRFKVSAIADVHKNRFFALFGHRCFKCGARERPHKDISRPPVLCMDHHVPMALGGHLVPGNLVALCRSCNERKLDSPPEQFYTTLELEQLQHLLNQQAELFSFSFDWDSWNKDREGYLLGLGVDAGLVREVLFNQEHPDYIGTGPDKLGITIEVGLNDLDESDQVTR